MRRALASPGGFSLVELMVVIAIISIISNVAIVKTGDAIAKARDRKRIANLLTLATAAQLYATDHDGRVPCTVCAGNATTHLTASSWDNPTFKTNGLCIDPGGPIIYPNLQAALGPYTPAIYDPGPPRHNYWFSGTFYYSPDGFTFAAVSEDRVENMFNFDKQYWDIGVLDDGSCSHGVDPANGQCDLGAIDTNAVMVSNLTKIYW
jgi:prepilin-type N-terminal cleavage/methylation domain-containing protein